MKLWPMNRFELRSNFSHAQALARMQSRVRPRLPIEGFCRQYLTGLIYRLHNEWWVPREYPWLHEDFWFAGKLTTEGFQLLRIGRFANSLVLVRGKFSPDQVSGTLSVRVWPSAWLLGLAILLLGYLGLALTALVVDSKAAGPAQPRVLITAGVMLAAYGLLTFVFLAEVRKVRNLLQKTLDESSD